MPKSKYPELRFWFHVSYPGYLTNLIENHSHGSRRFKRHFSIIATKIL